MLEGARIRATKSRLWLWLAASGLWLWLWLWHRAQGTGQCERTQTARAGHLVVSCSRSTAVSGSRSTAFTAAHRRRTSGSLAGAVSTSELLIRAASELLWMCC